MLDKMWTYACTTPGFSVAAFLLIWLAAWASNGVLKTTFNMGELRDLGVFVLGRFVIDSGLNSPIGRPIHEEKH